MDPIVLLGEGSTTPAIVTQLQTVITSITGSIDPATVASVIAAVFGAGIGFALLWSFARWAYTSIYNSIRGKGRKK